MLRVDMLLSVMKEKSAQWLEGLYMDMKDSSDTVINGLKKAVMYQAIPVPQAIQEAVSAMIIWTKIWTRL